MIGLSHGLLSCLTCLLQRSNFWGRRLTKVCVYFYMFEWMNLIIYRWIYWFISEVWWPCRGISSWSGRKNLVLCSLPSSSSRTTIANGCPTSKFSWKKQCDLTRTPFWQLYRSLVCFISLTLGDFVIAEYCFCPLSVLSENKNYF